jgi:ribosomal protein S12 methylthiotransferase
VSSSAPYPRRPGKPATGRPTVALVTLGCARNEVDSEELAGRLEAGGFHLGERADDASVVLVNTCGFVEAAKKDSVDMLLAAADDTSSGRSRAVVAVGCLAERYGKQLADELPEVDAVLGFDDYQDIAARLDGVLRGEPHVAHTPRDRRALLPIAPAERTGAAVSVPGHGQSFDPPDLPGGIAPASGPRAVRRRLGTGPVAPLKLASGCDRRCTFCAIPSFRGAYVSRRPADVVDEARWLTGHGVRELFLVSENSTSYGKDLGDLTLLESLLPALADIPDLHRVRLSYLQPAELRAGLITAIGSTPGVADYFDLSFQHAAPAVLRRMRRFGDPDRFLGLLDQIRSVSPDAGIRSNVIVGFPGETGHDVDTLGEFLVAARLDAVGVFGYSDEDGTAAARLPGKVDADEVRCRVSQLSTLVDELTAQRAEDRVGSTVEVLVERRSGSAVVGRSAGQGPEDGSTEVREVGAEAGIGDLVRAEVVGTDGVDLIARPAG